MFRSLPFAVAGLFTIIAQATNLSTLEPAVLVSVIVSLCGGIAVLFRTIQSERKERDQERELDRRLRIAEREQNREDQRNLIEKLTKAHEQQMRTVVAEVTEQHKQQADQIAEIEERLNGS